MAVTAASAPNGPAPPDAYPGTCRHLTRDERSRFERDGRRPAWRLQADDEQISFVDGIAGERTGRVDDFVVVRADGVPAYQLAVVVDDADSGIDQVARGDDLIPSTWRQIRLQQLLGLDSPEYWHLPLVVAADGRRGCHAVLVHEVGLTWNEIERPRRGHTSRTSR